MAVRVTITVPHVALDPAMERRLRAAAKKVQDGTAERNQLIVEASEAGASLREIAAAVGLEHTGVRKIILKAK